MDSPRSSPASLAYSLGLWCPGKPLTAGGGPRWHRALVLARHSPVSPSRLPNKQPLPRSVGAPQSEQGSKPSAPTRHPVRGPARAQRMRTHARIPGRWLPSVRSQEVLPLRWSGTLRKQKMPPLSAERASLGVRAGRSFGGGGWRACSEEAPRATTGQASLTSEGPSSAAVGGRGSLERGRGHRSEGTAAHGWAGTPRGLPS